MTGNVSHVGLHRSGTPATSTGMLPSPPESGSHTRFFFLRRWEIIKSEHDVYTSEILKDYPSRNSLMCEGLFPEDRNSFPFWYRESNMMDRQVNTGSSNIPDAAHSGSRTLSQEKDPLFVFLACEAGRIGRSPFTVRISSGRPNCSRIIHPAYVEGGRAC